MARKPRDEADRDLEQFREMSADTLRLLVNRGAATGNMADVRAANLSARILEARGEPLVLDPMEVRPPAELINEALRLIAELADQLSPQPIRDLKRPSDQVIESILAAQTSH